MTRVLRSTEKTKKAWHCRGTQQNKEELQSSQTTVNRHTPLGLWSRFSRIIKVLHGYG